MCVRHAELGNESETTERMDGIGRIQEAWRSLPPDVRQDIQRRAALMWQLRGAYFARFVAALNGLFLADPATLQRALVANRDATIQRLALRAGQLARLPRKRSAARPGFSDVQVRQHQRRQVARGRVPGRDPRNRRYRELEVELDQAARELEAPEPFFTRVTPIPGIGNKEGHEILTRLAMRGLPLSAADRAAVELGVIRPDRGGRSYWNFPRAALDSLTAAAQPAHALRPSSSSTVPMALGLIRGKLTGLYLRAMRSRARSTALEWVGEALHLVQDSFSSAHVERAGGTGRIRHIRAFFVRLGWPPLSRAPHEHNAPSDTRDDIYLHGAPRPQAHAAIRASRDYLIMMMRHLRAPSSPRNAAELRAFMNRYLSV